MSETGRDKFPLERKTYSAPLTNAAVGNKSEIACIDTSTGLLNPVGTSTTLLAIGYFQSNVVGDGTTPVTVELFDKLSTHFFDNDDAPNAVVMPDDRGASVYLKNGHTVSALSTGRSVAGIALNVDTVRGVEVLFGLPLKGATGDSQGVAQTVANRAALKSIASTDRFDGMVVAITEDGALFEYSSSSTVTADGSDVLAIQPTDAPATGMWLRLDSAFVASLAIGFGTADAAHLMTVPTGFVVKVADDPHYVVTTGFTGGTSSAIGISESISAGSTKGDLLGGAAGDVAATLVAGTIPGTAGAKMDTIAHRRAHLLVAGDYIRFDRITSAFTAGAGKVRLPVFVSRV